MTDMLRQFTIYDHPSDHPEHWVVREWHIGAGHIAPVSMFACGSLDEAREYVLRVDPGLVCIIAAPDDDPVIVETWT